MRNVLVTGAARGIGWAVVHQLVNEGCTVFAGVRKESDFSKFDGLSSVRPVLIDVSDTGSVISGFAQVDNLLEGGALHAIVHSAAIQPSDSIEVAAIEHFENTINTNAIGTIRVMKSAIPRLRHSEGKLLILSSLWGRGACPLLGAYCASKHALEAIADVARRETVGMSIQISVAQVGVVRTDMLDSATTQVDTSLSKMTPELECLYENMYLRYKNLVGNAAGTAITPERAAKHISNILSSTRLRTRYRFGVDSKVSGLMNWLMPDSWMDKALSLAVNGKPVKR